MLDVLITNLRDMDKSVLMNTDIDKCAEVDYISDRAFKLHSLFQILDVENITSEHWCWQFITGISARFGKFLYNIVKGWKSDSENIGK